MTYEFVTTAMIQAPPDRVWSVLTDAGNYAAWNPEIVGLAGRMALGERLKARVKVGSGAIRPVTMRITAFDPSSRRMEWTGGLPLGLFTGLRIFTVDSDAGGCLFRMIVRMSGPLAGAMVRSVGDRQKEIDGFSLALKAYVDG